MPQIPIRAYAVDAEIDGYHELILQIEIDDPVRGALRWVLPGCYLRILRDVLIDHIDKFPELTAPESKTVEGSRRSFTITGPPQKPELN